jgi:hypothetical protein
VEHTELGAQCMPVGHALARYTIWDGIRALDYLVSRPEVDTTRISVKGNSGGGTHSTYLAGFDDRIHVAAPSCYINSWRVLLDALGQQDAEQEAHRVYQALAIPETLQKVDFIYSFAPKPFLVDGHGYSKPRRQAAYRWFGRLKSEKEDGSEQDVPSAPKYYDLPHLAKPLAPRPVWMINARNSLGQVLPPAEVRGICSRRDSRAHGQGFSRPVNQVLDQIFK